MTPLIFRVLSIGVWLLFGFLCFVTWPDLVRVGYAISPLEPVDATLVMILFAALLGMVVHIVLADKVVLAPPVPSRIQAKIPEKSAREAKQETANKPKDLGSRSSQRLAAVQARFEVTPSPSDEHEISDLEAEMLSVRDMEKEGKLEYALALALRKGDKKSAARLYMKLGQLVQALGAYVELGDFEGAAMAATLKDDLKMARAFWRQAALALQNAGAANPNALGGLWDRAGNAAAAAASYEAGGMLNKALECFQITGDTKSIERIQQKMSLQPDTQGSVVVDPEEAKERARFLAERGDFFGAGEALLESSLHEEAAALFERIGDLPRAIRYYEYTDKKEIAEALRLKLEQLAQGAAASDAPEWTGVPPAGGEGWVSQYGVAPDPDTAEEEEAADGEDMSPKRPPASRQRAGVIAMRAAGIEIPAEERKPSQQRSSSDSPTPDADDDITRDTASRSSGKSRPPSPSDMASTNTRQRPRPAGVVRSLDMAPVDLYSEATHPGNERPIAPDSRATLLDTARAPFVPFPGELPTPAEVFQSPPPLPWKPGWPLIAPEPRSIGVPLFASVAVGEAVLINPPAFGMAPRSSGDDEGLETVRPTDPHAQDMSATLGQVQTLAGQGRFREAAELAASAEAWAAAATLLDHGEFWSEAADLWRRLGQWKDAVEDLRRLGCHEEAALLYLGAGRVARAVAVLRRGMRLNPENRDALADLAGRILVVVGRTDLGVRLLGLVSSPDGSATAAAVAVYRMGRILEEHEAFAEAHAVYVGLMEAGARNDDLREREQSLARELGKTRFLAPDHACVVGDEDMSRLDFMVTRPGLATSFPTVVDDRPATFLDLSKEQAIEWVVRSQPSIRNKGILRPRMMATPFAMVVPEDFAELSGEAKGGTAIRIATSPLSISLFGAPFAPPESWIQNRRFSIIETKSSLGKESLYLAEDSMLNQTVALRVFGRGSVQARGVAWMADRIRSLTALNHPNILNVLDMGVVDLRPYVVEPYVPTASMAERLKIGGAMPFVATLRIFVQIARGLEAAGRVGLVHGHIHPGQILFGSAEEALLSSWGVEILRKGPDLLESFPKGSASARPDIRALGLLAYVAIAGHPPAERNPLPLHGVRPDVPETFGQIVEWCLGLDPRRRYHAVGEFLPAVEQLLTAM